MSDERSLEHWLVALGPGLGDAALDWAARHAEGHAALEVIVSGLEVADPRARVLRAAGRLLATGAHVPRAIHMVPRSLAEELRRCGSVDLVVIGAPSGPLDRGQTNRVLHLLGACRSPVVLVPGSGSTELEPRVIAWPASGRRAPTTLRAAVRRGQDSLRVVRSPLPSSRASGS